MLKNKSNHFQPIINWAITTDVSQINDNRVTVYNLSILLALIQHEQNENNSNTTTLLRTQQKPSHPALELNWIRKISDKHTANIEDKLKGGIQLNYYITCL